MSATSSISANRTGSRLEGRVAAILTARELVINIGSNDGVEQGMRFAVLSETPLEIKDPGSQEFLGAIEREKVRVEAIEIKERLAICRTYRTRTTAAGPLYNLSRFGSVVGMTDPPRTVHETLRVEDSTIPPPLSPDESFVKINDRVVFVDDPD